MKKSDFYVHIFLLGCIGILVIGYLFLLNEVKKVKEKKIEPQNETIIQQVISKIIETPTPTPVPIKTVSPQPKKQETKSVTYINLNGSFETTNTDWTDVTSTDASINLNADYGESAYVDWEATVNAKNSGNKIYVRLYDTTNKIAVNGSELSSETATNARVSSNRLYLWRGQNTYRVQIKSLNGQSVEFLSGKIKIVY